MAPPLTELDPLDQTKIRAILPHRYPFLLVDRVLHLDVSASTCMALKNVTANEPFFQGHFPGHPLMPGVLIIEALAQAAGILVYESGFRESTAVLLGVRSAKFRRAVYPGDTLYLSIQGLHIGHRGARVSGQARIDNQILAAEAELSFAMVEPSNLSS